MPGGETILNKLTPRQKEIARLLASGLSQPQIAKQLKIAKGTCYQHTNNMRRRTNTTTAEIATKARPGI